MKDEHAEGISAMSRDANASRHSEVTAYRLKVKTKLRLGVAHWRLFGPGGDVISEGWTFGWTASQATAKALVKVSDIVFADITSPVWAEFAALADEIQEGQV